jgi:hypothetical protein
MILAHGGFASLMQAILNTPVPSHQVEEVVGIRQGGGQTRDARMHLLPGCAEAASVRWLSSLETCAAWGH